MKIEFDNVKARFIAESDIDQEAIAKACKHHRLQAPGALYMKSHKAYLELKKLHQNDVSQMLDIKNSSPNRKVAIEQILLRFRLDPVTVSYFLSGEEGWDGMVGAISPDFTFGTGMIPSIVASLWVNSQLTPTLIDNRPLKTLGMGNTTVPLRQYQTDAINKSLCNTMYGLWWPRGVEYIATGGGKTECAAAMIQIVNRPTLFLVHRLDLLYQAKERFEKYGLVVGIIGNQEFDPNPIGATVSTIQTIHKLLGRDPAKVAFLNSIEQVFFDEAHLLAADLDKGNIFVKTASFLPNAYMRWGLTATPFMKDKYSNWLLEGVTGGILYEIRNAELIQDNWLTPPRILMPKAPKVEGCPAKWADINGRSGAYSRGIVMNPGRNDMITSYALQLPKPCMILVTQTGHGEMIQNRLRDAGKDVPFLFGETPVKLRREVCAQVQNGKCDLLIASTIFDEGLDLPELRSLILAGGGKSPVKMLQRIGRGLRKAAGKHEVTVVDFVDTSAKVLKRHSDERKAVYINEGFRVEAVK